MPLLFSRKKASPGEVAVRGLGRDSHQKGRLTILTIRTRLSRSRQAVLGTKLRPRAKLKRSIKRMTVTHSSTSCTICLNHGSITKLAPSSANHKSMARRLRQAKSSQPKIRRSITGSAPRCRRLLRTQANLLTGRCSNIIVAYQAQ